MLQALSPTKLKKKLLCSQHFNDNAFASVLKKRLKRDAVPAKYQDSCEYLKVTTPVRTYGTKLIKPSIPFKRKLSFESSPGPSTLSPESEIFVQDLIELPEISASKPPPKSFKTKSISSLRKIIKRQKNIISSLKQKVSELQSQSVPKNASRYSKIFVGMQNRTKSRPKKWSISEKKLSLSLYYKSPSNYRFMRKKGIVLPAVPTVKNWISANSFKTGINDFYMQQLKIKADTMTNEEKKCAILFDEMSLKKFLEYSSKFDIIQGFEDLGSMGRTGKKATHALVLMLRGIYNNWKIPFAYFFCCNSMKSHNLKQILTICLENIIRVGMVPKILVCDQGTNNRSALSKLGVSTATPFFTHNDKKIFCIFDVPHLFKSLRNNWLKSDFICEQKLISFKDVIHTYEIDKKSASARLLTKITDIHINPNAFQKMNCKLALQIFSHTMASAIKSNFGLGHLNSSALNTSEFLEELNNLFDSLNSKVLYSGNPHNCGLSQTNPQVKNNLKRGLSLFRKLNKIDNGNLSRPPCFDGMVQSIRAILLLYEEELNENSKIFILTNRLNQDILEKFFSIIRQRGGYNFNPTCRIFQTSFRMQCIGTLIGPSNTANCEDDGSSFLDLTPILEQGSTIGSSYENPGPSGLATQVPDMEECGESESDNCTHTSDMSENDTEVTLEDCANVYYGGYLIKKTMDKFGCQNCRKEFVSENSKLTDKTQMYLLHKNYNSAIDNIFLYVPTENLMNIVKLSMSKFNEIYRKEPQMANISANIFQKINKELERKHTNFRGSCREHIEFLLRKLITTNLFKFTKWANIKVPSRSEKKNAKLKILQNE